MLETAAEANLRRELEETLAADPSSPLHHYNLGVFLWGRAEAEAKQEGDGEEARRLRAAAAENFLAAAKLNPNDGVPFRFLGHHYARGGDTQRGAKCYQRAVALNPDDAEAGEALCDLLDVEGKESLEVAVCKEAAGKSPRAFWAFQRLGYLQVHQRKWSEAIQSLQHAIRGYPTCADLWEALGLAYHRLGMFTAAVKSYGRAIELDSSRVFALIESGNIQLMLGYFRKGVEQFRSALEMAPRNHSAYSGLASALLAWARHCVTTGAFGWAASLLKEASEAAKVCTSLSGHLSCVWKLHGDVQLALARCFPWVDGKIKRGVDEQIFKDSILEWRNTCLTAANGAKLSYQRALHLAPWEANVRNDTAICLDLIYSLDDNNRLNPNVWELPEKMSLGALILEPVNKDYWVTLGSMSSNLVLKQHSFIRALHLDMSLSEAWAYLGKIYRQSGDQQLARQAFDRARSIDPSLALPWAGMSAENYHQSGPVNESFESCLRAVQIQPLPEFQVGLGTIAARSGNLLSPQVLMAVRQTVQRAPHYPESHNLNGLVSEVRSDFQSAITFYQHARFALGMMHTSKSDNRYAFTNVSVNLARSLCKAGLATDAVRECEELRSQGLLNADGLQIYAFALWRIGRSEEALSVSRKLAENLSGMKPESATAALGFICTLTYQISGKDSAAAVIHKLPGQLSYGTQLKFIISALDALQPNKRFQLPQLSMPPRLTSYEVMSEVHSNIALGKAIVGELDKPLRVDGSLSYLKKVLHMYPDCSLVRNQLGSLLLWSGDWMASHEAVRVTSLSHGHASSMGLKSPHQIQACAIVSCYTTCTPYPKFSFPTCEHHYLSGYDAIHHLQRWVHREPWNQDARYLLVLAIFQKARDEKYPSHICIILKRLILQVLSSISNSQQNKVVQYEMFLLLLSSSEVSLQSFDYDNCIAQAKEALKITPSSHVDTFFAHLQLCRAYAVQGDLLNFRNEYMKCLRNHTDTEIGWVMLKHLESVCSLEGSSDEIDKNLRECIKSNGSDPSKWASLFNLACAQGFIWDENFASAEKALAQACAEGDPDSCILFLNGATCMEIARRFAAPQFISRAASSLRKAQHKSLASLPIVSLLLAQAEGSLGSKTKWEKNLRLEWFSWPPELRPAEVYFQMHLLARQSAAAASQQNQLVETMQSPERWLLRAVHLNPSCSRYWKALLQLMDA
ncbi:tetratricopeptide repeat protein SKI3 isoform X2 [Phragmites australis]|uniref:tetratricopeptide repeat protein SKI3 isoform X2 n=1 Tax=Phragmites australis TaxID=29695 RepID=UPI002D77C2A2|nr:tetratricopeptide repeat protein SKI3 isoform X2 [Phragmites australis]